MKYYCQVLRGGIKKKSSERNPAVRFISRVQVHAGAESRLWLFQEGSCGGCCCVQLLLLPGLLLIWL